MIINLYQYKPWRKSEKVFMSGGELLAGKSQYLVMLVGLVGREKVSLFSFS